MGETQWQQLRRNKMCGSTRAGGHHSAEVHTQVACRVGTLADGHYGTEAHMQGGACLIGGHLRRSRSVTDVAYGSSAAEKQDAHSSAAARPTLGIL